MFCNARKNKLLVTVWGNSYNLENQNTAYPTVWTNISLAFKISEVFLRVVPSGPDLEAGQPANFPVWNYRKHGANKLRFRQAKGFRHAKEFRRKLSAVWALAFGMFHQHSHKPKKFWGISVWMDTKCPGPTLGPVKYTRNWARHNRRRHRSLCSGDDARSTASSPVTQDFLHNRHYRAEYFWTINNYT